MNILVVCHYGLYKDFGASFVHAQTSAYVALGHRVRVIVPIAVGKRDWSGSQFSGSFPLQRANGVELCPLRHLSLSNYGKRGFNTATALQALRWHLDTVLDGFFPDIIHAHALGTDSSLGVLLKERLGVPLVVTTHGSDTSVPIEEGRGNAVKRLCSHADTVVAVSSALAGRLSSCGTKTPVSVILNGFHIHNLPERGEKQNLSFVQAGNLLEQKGFHVTIQAFAQIQTQHPEATLTLLGDGPYRGELESLCQKLNITGSVRFLGKRPNTEVLAEMGKSCFFIMPSVREGFGIVYLEAMASGCVTIGTMGEGIADVITSGKNGFLIPPGDPSAIVHIVEWCLAHPEKSAAIAERGHRDALGLTWKRNAEQYIQLYEALRGEHT